MGSSLFMFQTRKTLFGQIWLKKSKLSVKTEIQYQETYLNMPNSMMMLTFSQFLTGNTFLSKFDPKNKDCQFELKFCSRLILICRIMQKLCGVHFFCFRPEKPFLGKYEEFNSVFNRIQYFCVFDWKYTVFLKFVPKIKIVS